jgi:hypothetical protein
MKPTVLSLFPNASAEFQRLNAGLGLPPAEPKPAAPEALVDRAPREAASDSRVKLSYLARIVRPLDPDNLAGSTKYITDALVRCGLVDGDSPEKIEIAWAQEKVAHYDEEALVITISGLERDRSRSAATDESAAKPKNRRKIK